MTKIAKKQEVLAPQQESIVNDAPKLHSTFEVGDVAHQGDLIIVRIEKLPAGAKPRVSRQLADGDTQGSRHILARGDVFDAPAHQVQALVRQATGLAIPEQYLGPVFVSPTDPTAEDLDHPEHGSQGFPAGAVCAVVYQRSLDQEEREQRVLD